MRRIALRCAVAIVVFMSFAGTAFSAALEPGDKPKFSAKTLDGKPITLESLEGKLVLLEYWTTTCGRCTAELPHMAMLHERFGPRGLVVIGVSLDENLEKLTQYVETRQMTWTQIADKHGGGGLGMFVAGEGGLINLPSAVLFSPDGVVLWRGSPSQVDGPLGDAFQQHPPRIVDPKVLAEATVNLGKVEAALKEEDKAAAAKAFAKIPADARKEKILSVRIAAAAKQLDEYAAGLLEEATKLVDEKQYIAAIPKLRDISKMTGLASAKAASEKLNELQASPELKAQIAAAEKADKEKGRSDRAAAALAIAEKLQGEKKNDQAYAQYQSVAKLYEGTPAAQKATDAVKTYEKDPAFMKSLKARAAGTQAKSTMTLAESYVAAGQYDLARKKFQQIIDQFPGSDDAVAAKKAMDDLPR